MMPQPRLLATSGPLQGGTFALGDAEFSIGRTGDVSLTIDHMSVSRRHCVFSRQGTSYSVRDLDSLNGTMLNGERVKERAIQHGDIIRVGNSTFLFITRDEEGSASLTDVRLTEDEIDPASTRILRRDEAVYLDPLKALAGADVRATRAFDVLVKLSTAVQASQSFERLQEEVLRLLMAAIPAEAGAIVLTGGHAEDIVSMFGRRADGGASVAVSRTVLAKVLKDKTALLNDNVSETLKDSRSLIDARTRTLLCVPLVSGDRAFGALYMTGTQDRSRFEESHLQLLTAASAMLALPLEKARQVEWLSRENQRLHADIDENRLLVGDSDAMNQVYKFITRVAATESTVLIRGESGTGKELVAHAIHRGSPREKAPFVVVNCAALKADLLESELFGHEKGAFTSAIALKKGKFELADGGTVFLDELGELAPELQAKLLRVLQEREFERVGGIRPIKVNVRVIAATNQDLEEGIRQGRFRHELYYRLNVVSIECPPLRRRVADIVPLALYFTTKYVSRYNSRIRGISPEAQACLTKYDWPGNVRELQNAIERAVVLGDSELIVPEDLPEVILDAHPPSTPSVGGFHDSLREAKRRKIQDALDQTKGNISEAAKLLGVNRTYLHRLIRTLGLDKT